MINYNEFYNAKFVGKKEYCGFKHGDEYTIKITENRPYGLVVSVLGSNEFSMDCPYCNLASVQRVWEIKE